jgi:hypothetical protein
VRVAVLLAVGGAGFVALLASPVGRAYFGALRAADAGDAAGTAGLEGESRIAFGGPNGYNEASGGRPGRGGAPRQQGKR